MPRFLNTLTRGENSGNPNPISYILNRMGLKGGILGTSWLQGTRVPHLHLASPSLPHPQICGRSKYLTEGSRPRRGRRLLPIALAPHHKPCRRGPRVTPAAAIWSEPAMHTLPNQNQLSPN